MCNVTAEHSATMHHDDDDEQSQSYQISGMPGVTNDGMCGLCVELPCCRSCLRQAARRLFHRRTRPVCGMFIVSTLHFYSRFYRFVATGHHISRGLLSICFSDVCQKTFETTATRNRLRYSHFIDCCRHVRI